MASYSYTLNHALTLEDSGNPLVDFYFRMVPGVEPEEGMKLTRRAAETSLLGMLRLAFDLRNCRGGKGRRDLFYMVGDYALAQQGTAHFHAWMHNLQHVAHYGYWKDLWQLLEHQKDGPSFSPLCGRVLELFGRQLQEDCQALFGTSCEGYHQAQKKLLVDPAQKAGITLAAKYAPSPKKHFARRINACGLLYRHLGMSERSYRWMLAEMRRYIDLVEQKMSAGLWDEIVYAKVPSRCLLRHAAAFEAHDPSGWGAHKQRVRAGGDKLNVGQLMPYELVQRLRGEGAAERDAVELMLGEYIRKHGTSLSQVVCVADTSGSMTHGGGAPLPIDVCLSLALMAAENTEGAFRNRYIAFSERSEVVRIEGESYAERIGAMMAGPWGNSTNLQSAFDHVRQAMLDGEEVRVVIVISDMQFDSCGADRTNFEDLSAKFTEVGLVRPLLVFWNVAATGRDSPVAATENGTILVSGCSPSLFELIVKAPEDINPLTFVQSVIDDPRYERISLPSGKREPNDQDVEISPKKIRI